MNSLIHLRPKDGDWEILSVVQEGGRPISGLVTTGSAMRVEGMGPQQVYDFLGSRMVLGSVPAPWRKRLEARVVFPVQLDEIAGYLK